MDDQKMTGKAMKSSLFGLFRLFTATAFTFCAIDVSAQGQTPANPPKAPSEFWRHVQFGGGVGLGFGSGFTNISLSPSAIYNFNEYVSAGVGLSGSYVKYKDYSPAVDQYQSWLYGGSIIGLFSPISQLQLSVELEQLRVNTTLDTDLYGEVHDDFWSTALFIGAGYRTQNVTIGLRYNLLFDPDTTVYADSWGPFVRVYF